MVGVAGSATYSDAVAIMAILPTTIAAETSTGPITIDVENWVDTDFYNPNTVSNYTFTATPIIPGGYLDNIPNYATIEVIISFPTPTVTKLGDGLSDYSMTATPEGSTAYNRGDLYAAQLNFNIYNNPILNIESKTAIEDAILAGAGTSVPTFAWNNNNLRIYSTTATLFSDDVLATITYNNLEMAPALGGSEPNSSIELLLIDSVTEKKTESKKRSSGSSAASIVLFQKAQQAAQIDQPGTKIPLSITNRTLKSKTSGEDVKNLQSFLKLKGFLFEDKDIDSKFGPKTRLAVIAFQKANNLTADGIVGPKTRELIK